MAHDGFLVKIPASGSAAYPRYRQKKTFFMVFFSVSLHVSVSRVYRTSGSWNFHQISVRWHKTRKKYHSNHMPHIFRVIAKVRAKKLELNVYTLKLFVAFYNKYLEPLTFMYFVVCFFLWDNENSWRHFRVPCCLYFSCRHWESMMSCVDLFVCTFYSKHWELLTLFCVLLPVLFSRDILFKKLEDNENLPQVACESKCLYFV